MNGPEVKTKCFQRGHNAQQHDKVQKNKAEVAWSVLKVGLNHAVNWHKSANGWPNTKHLHVEYSHNLFLHHEALLEHISDTITTPVITSERTLYTCGTNRRLFHLINIWILLIDTNIDIINKPPNWHLLIQGVPISTNIIFPIFISIIFSATVSLPSPCHMYISFMWRALESWFRPSQQ